MTGGIDIKFTTENLKHLTACLTRFDDTLRDTTATYFRQLGKDVQSILRRVFGKHRVSGQLQESVEWTYHPAPMRLEVGPTKRFGRFYAGNILEHGTGPIPSLPFTPIKRWAEKRFIPSAAGPIWMTIKRRGVQAHPWSDSTLARTDTRMRVARAAERIGIHLAAGAVGSKKTEE